MTNWACVVDTPRFRLADALKDRAVRSWPVDDRHEAVHAGDGVALWESGRDGNVVALLRVRGEAHEASGPEPAERPYYTGNESGGAPQWRVPVTVEVVFREPLSRAALGHDPVLGGLPVIHGVMTEMAPLDNVAWERLWGLAWHSGDAWNERESLLALRLAEGAEAANLTEQSPAVQELALLCDRATADVAALLARCAAYTGGQAEETDPRYRQARRVWGRYHEQGARLERAIAVQNRPLTRTPPASVPPPSAVIDTTAPGWYRAVTTRTVRETLVGRLVLAWYDHTCQACGARLRLLDGAGYAESYHLQSLGAAGGFDLPGNVLCLCPTHQVEFALGALSLVPGIHPLRLAHVDAANPVNGQPLRLDERHALAPASVRHHFENVFRGDRAATAEPPPLVVDTAKDVKPAPEATAPAEPVAGTTPKGQSAPKAAAAPAAPTAEPAPPAPAKPAAVAETRKLAPAAKPREAAGKPPKIAPRQRTGSPEATTEA